MSKQEFLAQLRKGLSGLPREDMEECLTFYSEMLEDRMEEGFSEEDAVSAAGPVHEIVAQVIADTPFTKIAKERIKSKKRLSKGSIVLLAIGSPIWLSLVIAVSAVILALYISLWSVIVSFWAVFASLAVCPVIGVPACFIFIADGNVAKGIASLAAGIICAGLSIFAFYGCKTVTKVILLLTKKMAIWLKSCFIKKEEA